MTFQYTEDQIEDINGSFSARDFATAYRKAARYAEGQQGIDPTLVGWLHAAADIVGRPPRPFLGDLRPLVLTMAGVLAFGAAGALALKAVRMSHTGRGLPLIAGFSSDAPGAWTQLGAKPATADFADGMLTITPAAGVAGAAFNGVHSTLKTDFTGQAWSLKADLTHLHLQHGLEAKFRITRSHQTDYLSLEAGDRDLEFVQKYDGQLREKRIPFDPVAHRWFRMRHIPADDTIRWETSPDGRSWTERARDQRRFDLRKVKVELYAGTYEPLPAPGWLRFSDWRQMASAR